MYVCMYMNLTSFVLTNTHKKNNTNNICDKTKIEEKREKDEQ